MASEQEEDHVGLEFGLAIRAGDLGEVQRMLAQDPELASKPIRVLGSRIPLSVVTDWPGYFSNGPEIVHLLASAGADPNVGGKNDSADETPLHWAASSDDVDVAEALLDIGADIEAPGSSIAGGAPLENAVGYGCWHVARLLVARGARVNYLWQAAALGMTERVTDFLASTPRTPEEITEAFWQACSGGQRRLAEVLLAQGADINGRPDYTEQSPLQAAESADTRRGVLADWLREQGAIASER
jgi:ankyrin repeat protein